MPFTIPVGLPWHVRKKLVDLHMAIDSLRFKASLPQADRPDDDLLLADGRTRGDARLQRTIARLQMTIAHLENSSLLDNPFPTKEHAMSIHPFVGTAVDAELAHVRSQIEATELQISDPAIEPRLYDSEIQDDGRTNREVRLGRDLFELQARLGKLTGISA